MTRFSSSTTVTRCDRRALIAHSSTNDVSLVAVSQVHSGASAVTEVSMRAPAVSTRERSTSWMKEAT